MSWVAAYSVATAQDSTYYTVVAQQGDGIFSLLRKEGLDPVKHYGEFLDLNAAQLGEGSFLKVGLPYRIPRSGDGLRSTGILIRTDRQGVEEPIFQGDLAQFSPQSDNLKDAIYYIINDNQDHATMEFVGDIVKDLAAELMVHGAKVYVLGEQDTTAQAMSALKGNQRLGGYIDAINKRFLQNRGKYQRVLVIRTLDLDGQGPFQVALYHDDRNQKGQRLAQNIQRVFKNNGLAGANSKVHVLATGDSSGLYLSNNILPALSLLTLEKSHPRSDGRPIAPPNKERFAGWISHGIMNDFAELEIEQ